MKAAELETNTPTFEMDQSLIAGRYRPCDRIGRGRLGDIFEALDEGYDDLGVEHRVAIQLIPETIVRNNLLFNKLNVGYSVLRAAEHPHIVRFLHFGRHGKRGFLVMELLDGASLRKVMEDAGTLPIDEVMPVIRGIGEALQLLHSQDMVHGNLTAANVFFSEELEVRLLDVLPLGADQAIVRGGATSSPFSRCTGRDDVFGLACLAYEMLAGTHPYNFSPPAEASLAGLQAARIESLDDSQWNALRLALSLDHELRTASVADFMRDFGIRGNECLRPAAVRPPRHDVASYPQAETPPPAATLPGTAPVVEPVISVANVDPVVPTAETPRTAKPANTNSAAPRTTLLAILLVMLGAWAFYGQPHEQISGLIDRVDKMFVVGRPEQQNRGVVSTASGPDRSNITGRSTPVDRPDATASITDVDVSAADVETPGFAPDPVEDPVVDPVVDVEKVAVPAAESVDDTVLSAPPAEGQTADEQQATSQATAAESTEPRTGPVQPEAAAAFANPVVSVSEGDGAVRIIAPQTGYSGSPKIWWTSEYSASADEDFIAVEQQLVAGPTVEGSDVLLVPLVNDSLPEPPESFFVSLGFRDPERGHIERIATVRVDVIDDD